MFPYLTHQNRSYFVLKRKDGMKLQW